MLLLLGLSTGSAAGDAPISVKADPARPGRVLVGTTKATKGEPVEVVSVRDKRRTSFYRSPDPAGFEVCDFLRYAGLSFVPGPIDVTVWRGELSASLRLDYDGRSCAAEPMPAAGSPTRTIPPLVIPTMAPPPPQKAPEKPVEDGWASARLERVFLSEDGRSHRFVALFDTDVRPPARARVFMKRLIRIDLQKEVPVVVTKLPVKPVDRGFDWKTQSGLLRFDPPLRNGEQLWLSFEIGGRSFDRQTVTFVNPS